MPAGASERIVGNLQAALLQRVQIAAEITQARVFALARQHMQMIAPVGVDIIAQRD